MLRCFSAVTERHLQTLPWQAVGVLQKICIHQQLPCVVASIQQTCLTGHGLSQLAGQCRSQQQQQAQEQQHQTQQQQQHQTQQQSTGQQSSPWCAAMDILRQNACVKSQEQPAASFSLYRTQQHHLPHHRRAYSIMSSGHALYHTRHSGESCSTMSSFRELWQPALHAPLLKSLSTTSNTQA